MKILLVTPMPPQAQPTNAVPMVTRAQIVGLRERHQITLVTVAGPDPLEWQALDELQAMGIEVHAVGRTEPSGLRRWQRRWRLGTGLLRSSYPFRTLWFWEPAIQCMLDDLLAARTFDLVHLVDNAVGIYRYHTAAPILYTEIEVRRPRPIQWRGWSQVGWRRWAWNELEWQRWQSYQLRVWRRSDCIHVFTRRDAEIIGKMDPSLAARVRINPFGIELPAPADPVREERNTIVFSGGFTHPPNVDAALWLARDIMPQLRRLCPGARLILVGSYPTAEICALACADIIVTGRVPCVEDWLERAAVIIAPVRIGGGMRTKVLQGMALAKPVVTTSLGTEGLNCGGELLPLVIADNGAEIAQAVATLLADDARRRALGRHARAFVSEHYSADAFGRRLETIFAELVRKSPVSLSL